MKTTAVLFILSTVLVYGTSRAANGPSSTFATQFLHPKDWAFEENRGQLADPAGNALPEIKYFGSFGGVQVYCTAQKLSFVFTKKNLLPARSLAPSKIGVKLAMPAKSTISASRLDLEFESSNPDVKIVTGNKQEMTINYATPRSGKDEITGVSFYKTLTYINLYSHIDMVVTANNKGLEYEFIVHAGGNINDIKLVRNGADAMEMLTNGGIQYTTSFGALEESKPQSFSASKLINSNFIRSGNKLSFKTEDYDHNKDLVIDPGLQWSTYFGGDSDDRAYSIALDPSGNVYITGFTNSLNGIATKGAYQVSVAGASHYDALVAKFSGSGKLVWATYFGGDSDDFANYGALDNAGDLYVTGYTLSPKGIATSGAYQTSLGGSNDAFLAKFNSNGGLIWSTYLGGSGDDYGWTLAIDNHNSAYMYGFTGSATGIATKGSFQTSFGGGQYDAFIAKFSSKGALDWSTYFGGNGEDQGTGIGIDGSSNIYITGFTLSTNGIATSGAYKTSVDATNGNAFVACLDSNGTQKWGTYFGGNGAGDIGFAIATNGKDKVYITGFTGNDSGVATAGSYQSVFGGGQGDVFLADFSSSGSLNWATYYGGNDFDLPYGISSDSSGNIYITGFTYSTGQIATSGAFQTSLASTFGANAFLAKFNGGGILKYGTYFGGDMYEEGHGVANDNSGDVFIAGLTSSSGLATSGAYQTSNAGGTAQNPYDAFIAKFVLCNLNTSISGPSFACANSIASYKALSHPNSTYDWVISGGSIQSGTGTDSITVKWTGSGTGSVGEVETNSGCQDGESLSVTIGPLPAPVITGDTVVCPFEPSSYHVSPASGVSYSWVVTAGSISSLPGRDSIDVLWSSTPGKGTVTIKESASAGSCQSSDTVNITIDPNPVAHVKITDNGKGAYEFRTTDSSLASSGYSWVINGTKYTGYHIQKTFNHDSTYRFSLTVTNSAGCNGLFDSTLTVSGAGISQINPEDLDVSIFPNPFKEQTEIYYSVSSPGLVEITVSDMLGRNIAILQNKNLQPGNYVSLFDAKVFHITQGIYLVTVRTGGGMETQRIVKE